MAFLLALLHVGHVHNDLLAHEIERIAEHLACLALLAGHDVQACQHLADADGQVEAALHAGPPAP